VKLTIPVRIKLCKVEEITEVDTFNSALKCSEWRNINSVTRQTFQNINNPFRKERVPDGTDTQAFKQLIRMVP